MADATTSMDFSECYSQAIAEADRALNAQWAEVVKLLSEYPDTLEALRIEQRKWISFKEEACGFYWGEGFGSMHRSIIGPDCHLRVIEDRTSQLAEIEAMLKPDY